MDDRPFYYRVRGRLFGPFDLRQMRQFAQRVQIIGGTDVSRDSIQWAKASDFPEIFVGSATPPPPTSLTDRSVTGKGAGGETLGNPVPSGPNARWFYTVNGAQQGPVDLAALQQLVATGAVSAREYVFREGDAEWVSATRLPTSSGMQFVDGASGGGGRPGRRDGAPKGGAGTAIASMVLGLLGLVACLLPIVGLPTTITGLTLGIMSRRHGMGVAGICLASLGLVLSVVNASVGAYLNVLGASGGVTASTYEFAILDGALALDGKKATLPLTFAAITQMIGRPSRTSHLENTIYTWDHLGMLAYQAPGASTISEVHFCFKPETYAFSPRSAFDALVVNEVTLTAASTKEDVLAAGFQPGEVICTARIGGTEALCRFNDFAVPGVREEGLIKISCSKAN